jgi:hypothetical protein
MPTINQLVRKGRKADTRKRTIRRHFERGTPKKRSLYTSIYVNAQKAQLGTEQKWPEFV